MLVLIFFLRMSETEHQSYGVCFMISKVIFFQSVVFELIPSKMLKAKFNISILVFISNKRVMIGEQFTL